MTICKEVGKGIHDFQHFYKPIYEKWVVQLYSASLSQIFELSPFGPIEDTGLLKYFNISFACLFTGLFLFSLQNRSDSIGENRKRL